MKFPKIEIRNALAWLYAAGVFLFLFFGYRYHIYFQEQFQLFEFTGSYFTEVFCQPGGLASYISRFLTQFSYYAFAGSVICAALVSAIRLLTFRLCGNFPLSFIPSSLMLFFILDGEAMLTAPVALLIVLAVANLRVGIISRGWVTVAISAILYFLVGPFAALYPAIRLHRAKNWWLWGIVCAAVLCAEVHFAHLYTHYPYGRLLYGLGYYRFFIGMPALPWIAALSAVIVYYVGAADRFGRKVERILCAVVLAASAAGIFVAADFEREEAMEYDFLARRGMWDAIIAKAEVKAPDTPNNVTCLNLALAMKGQLKSRMFDFFQCGTEGLMPEFSSDYLSSFPVSEAYFYLGMVNTARRYTFATQENNPDGQKSARCYKRLAEANMVNGLYDAAELYLKPLRHTLFYREWAEDFSRLMKSEDSIEKHPLYGFLRKSRLHNDDFMFNRSATDSMLAYLIKENPNNSLAYEYLYAWLLLDKKIDELKALFGLQSDKEIPANYWNYYKQFRKGGNN